MFKDTLVRLRNEKLIHPQDFVLDNLSYAVIMGSMAYGVTSKSSDWDIYGFTVPPKEIVFPHLNGDIEGFGRQKQKFEQWQEHHIYDASSQIEYDFGIYNIIKYFQLCMENNPNMLDSLFVPDRCVLHQNKIGKHIRENRKLFLHKGSMHKLRGYAFSQKSKIFTKNKGSGVQEDLDILRGFIEKYHLDSFPHPSDMEFSVFDETDSLIIKGILSKNNIPSNKNRLNGILFHKFDTKYSYHLVRLMLEAEQIAREHDLDIERNSDILKTVRNGEWSMEKLESWFDAKSISIEEDYSNSSLRDKPDENELKRILMECLEMQFGSLSNLQVSKDTSSVSLVAELKTLIEKYSN